MRKEWETKTLGEIAKILGGKRLPKGYDLQTSKTNHPYIRVTDFNDEGSVSINDLRYISTEIHNQISKYVIYSDDLYISIAGTIGKAGIIPKELNGANLTENACRLKFSNGYDNRFVYYFTKSQSFIEQAGLNTRTAAQPKLALGRLSTISLSIPPIEEQKQIVEILDKAFADLEIVRTNAETNLKNARTLLETTTNLMFDNLLKSFPSTTLGNVCSFENGDRGVNYPGKNHRVAKGIPFINAGHLTNRHVIDFSEMDYITEERFNLLGNGKIKEDDILFCLRGSLGKFAVVENIEKGAIASSLVIIRPTNSIRLEYLMSYLGSTLCFNMIEQLKGGAAQPNLGVTDLKKFVLPLPDKETQIEFSNKLMALEKDIYELIECYNKKVVEIDDLKQAILAKAFSGELLKDDNVIQLNVSANSNTKAPEFTANIIAYAHLKHKMALRDWSFKRVKAQKFLHLVESIGGIDLGRQPRKLQYGPHDENHMNSIQEFAKKALFFEFVQQKSGHDFAERLNYNQLLAKAKMEIKPFKALIDKILEIIIPMDSRQAEVFATVHAAWNNLLLDGKQPTSEEIIYEARENWHPKKLDIPKSEFETAIKLIKSHGVEPKGEGKRVIGNEKLL